MMHNISQETIDRLLNDDPRSPFTIFATEMHQNNCIEREAFGDPILTYEQYVEKNIKFLLDNMPSDSV